MEKTEQEIASLIEDIGTNEWNYQGYAAASDKFLFVKDLLEENEIPTSSSNLSTLEDILEASSDENA